MLLNCGVGEDSWESLGLQGDPTSPSSRRSVLCVHWKDWCWNWNSNTLATWFKELTHLKISWSWERLRAGGEGDNRGWDGWMAPPTQWTWVWVNPGSWWWTGRPGVLQSIGSQRVGNDWTTELNWNVFLQIRSTIDSELTWQTCLFYSHIVLLIYVNETVLLIWKPAFLQDSYQSFYGEGWLSWCHMLSQNACCGWGAWCHSLSVETFTFSN